MNRLIRFTGLTLAIALSIAALLPPNAAAAIYRPCYCEVYCSDGSYSFGQAGSRYECSQFFQQQCGGSGTWVCPYQ